MTRRMAIVWLMAALAGAQSPQEAEPKKAATKKNDGKKTAAEMTVHAKVAAEGMEELPSGSQIVIEGREGCEFNRTAMLDTEGSARFSRVPVCKAQVMILITGFDTKMVTVDLANFKDAPMRVLVKASGPAVVN